MHEITQTTLNNIAIEARAYFEICCELREADWVICAAFHIVEAGSLQFNHDNGSGRK